MNRFHVYMLLCVDQTFYVGVTNDLERRVAQHEYGNDPESYTFSRRPVRLVHSSDFQSVLDAIDWEKRLKKWSHAKKAALVQNDFSRVHKLAKCKNATAATPRLAPSPLDAACPERSRRARGDESSARGDESSARGDESSARGDESSARGDESSARGDCG
jgi:putative endonuclease